MLKLFQTDFWTIEEMSALCESYLQPVRSPILDCRPPTRLERPSPPASRLLLRSGVDGARLEVEVVRALGDGSMLLRRLFIMLRGRARRAAGLSSAAAVSSSSSSSTIDAWRLGPGDEERGVERMASLPLAGVEGEFIGLARGRRDACCDGVVDEGRLTVCCAGVVDAGRRAACCAGVVEAGRLGA
jgi:hypothetical protein